MGASNHNTVKPIEGKPRDPEFDIEPDAFLITGPVASGKTTALEVAEQMDGFFPYDMGDEARRLHAEEFEGQDKDETPSVSEWANRLKANVGDDWLAQKVCDRYADWHNDYGGVPVISGVRSPAERDRYAEAFGEVEMIWVWSTIWTRAERALGRSDRKLDTPAEFFERDYREYQWGLDLLTQPGEYDVYLPNENVSKVQFESMVQKALIGAHRGEDEWQTNAPWHYGEL